MALLCQVQKRCEERLGRVPCFKVVDNYMLIWGIFNIDLHLILDYLFVFLNMANTSVV